MTATDKLAGIKPTSLASFFRPWPAPYSHDLRPKPKPWRKGFGCLERIA